MKSIKEHEFTLNQLKHSVEKFIGELEDVPIEVIEQMNTSQSHSIIIGVVGCIAVAFLLKKI